MKLQLYYASGERDVTQTADSLQDLRDLLGEFDVVDLDCGQVMLVDRQLNNLAVSRGEPNRVAANRLTAMGSSLAELPIVGDVIIMLRRDFESLTQLPSEGDAA